ncbi:disease resistance protein RUN1-like [Malus domestica]|uniref:disease resistance protein RUN1-like n=1 Tax=Malus domestica TaxID=3750 RepID=UPI0039751661
MLRKAFLLQTLAYSFLPPTFSYSAASCIFSPSSLFLLSHLPAIQNNNQEFRWESWETLVFFRLNRSGDSLLYLKSMNTSSPAHATAAAAGGSSSSRRSSWKNEVFLSFRGEDTRTGFTDHLLKALRDAGINTFIDDELKRGENIQRELDREIEGSRIAVVVFSKNYAESRWCLRELSKIMREGKAVYPIFYNVDPSQLREQSGSLGEAFQNEDPNEVEQWRKDLKACADLSGRTFKTTAGGREALFIQNVVWGHHRTNKNQRLANKSVNHSVGIPRRVGQSSLLYFFFFVFFPGRSRSLPP